MPLQDRDYMREPEWDSRRSLTVTLIITLIGLFVVQCCLMFYAGLPLDDWFGLSLSGIKEGRVWQLLTFQFMHAAPWPWHVLLNCVGLYFFGRSVEQTLGRKRFLVLYLVSGVIGGILHLLVTWLLPNHPDSGVVGASAGICGLLATFACLYPMREITAFIYFFPVTIRAQYFFWFVLGLSIFGTLIPYNNTAHAAHLGGMLVGVAYVRWVLNSKESWFQGNPFRRKARRERMFKVAALTQGKARRRSEPDTIELPSEEFISQEVDPILDKISAHGIQSLTERERKILQAARDKMSRR